MHPVLLFLLALGIVLVIAGILYRILMSPELEYHSLSYRVKAKIVFWVGDIRRLGAFPWVTWAPHGDHMINLSDVREAVRLCRPGDIGLHRDRGYLSNVGIPGAFKHAWVIVDDDLCVEAISEGVVRRDNMYPLVSDYAIILRPENDVTLPEIRQAVERANSIVGYEYDANFKFDFERGERDIESQKYCTNLKCGEYHGAFSCTETVGYAYYPFRKKLGLFRSNYAGREAIVADDYLKMRFQIVWASPSITMEWAKQAGLHEMGRVMIEDYLARKGQ